MHPSFSGLLPALTTPFRDGAPALDRLRENLARYEAAGLSGYLALGSTGEAVLLDDDERDAIVTTVRETVAPGRPLLAGVTAESTPAAVRQALRAADAGADAVLISTPHYFRGQMSGEAMLAHFEAIAEASPIPALLYNVPKFTNLSIPVETVSRAAAHPGIVGMKESSGEPAYLHEVLSVAPRGFTILCGDVTLAAEAIRSGAAGAVLAAAVAFPEPLLALARGEGPPRELLEACRIVAGRHGVPGLKYVMDLRGLHGGDPRPPLLAPGADARREIEAALAELVTCGALPGRALAS